MITKEELFVHDTFIVFGAGNTGKRVSSVLNGLGKKVNYFLVSNKSQQRVSSEVPDVISLDDEDRIINKNVPVIIAVFNREKDSNISSIISLLEQKGFTKVITFFEFHAIFAEELGDNFWLTRPSFYQENHLRLTECLSLLYEEKSRLLYNQMIDFFDSFDTDLLSEPDMDHQYFPYDLTVWDGFNTFVDVGTYDGQNVIDAAEKYGVLSKVIAFEPDLNNLKKINNLVKWPDVAKEAVIYPCGVWSKSQILNFSSGAGESNAISDDGTIKITVVSLDEVLKGVVPGFIKMDIEGAEIEALNGAKNLITTHKPSMAISIYHTPGHLFEIPILLANWDLGYKFYIRFHGHNLFDTVLYCLIEDRK